MRAVLTRVSSASVTVQDDVQDGVQGTGEGTANGTGEGTVVGSIDCPTTGGLLALVGVSKQDVADANALTAKITKMADKIAHLRILAGEKSVTEQCAPVLVVSQFTLYGQTAKGRRPSWSDAASGEDAYPVIHRLVSALKELGVQVEQGKFGSMMKVTSVNEGPFTVLVET